MKWLEIVFEQLLTPSYRPVLSYFCLIELKFFIDLTFKNYWTTEIKALNYKK